MPENEIDRIKKVNDYFGSVIHGKAKSRALLKMDDEDFILITDAREITEGVSVAIGNNRRLSTIKRSSGQKYITYYHDALEIIMERLVK